MPAEGISNNVVANQQIALDALKVNKIKDNNDQVSANQNIGKDTGKDTGKDNKPLQGAAALLDKAEAKLGANDDKKPIGAETGGAVGSILKDAGNAISKFLESVFSGPSQGAQAATTGASVSTLGNNQVANIQGQGAAQNILANKSETLAKTDTGGSTATVAPTLVPKDEVKKDSTILKNVVKTGLEKQDEQLQKQQIPQGGDAIAQALALKQQQTAPQQNQQVQ